MAHVRLLHDNPFGEAVIAMKSKDHNSFVRVVDAVERIISSQVVLGNVAKQVVEGNSSAVLGSVVAIPHLQPSRHTYESETQDISTTRLGQRVCDGQATSLSFKRTVLDADYLLRDTHNVAVRGDGSDEASPCNGRESVSVA
jgi:hypothetical protein